MQITSFLFSILLAKLLKYEAAFCCSYSSNSAGKIFNASRLAIATDSIKTFRFFTKASLASLSFVFSSGLSQFFIIKRPSINLRFLSFNASDSFSVALSPALSVSKQSIKGGKFSKVSNILTNKSTLLVLLSPTASPPASMIDKASTTLSVINTGISC